MRRAPAHAVRRQRVRGAFATFAAVAFAAASFAPLGAAVAQAETAPRGVSQYADSLPDAQRYDVEKTDGHALGREGMIYTVYVTPKPTPTPEPVTAEPAAAARPSYSGGGSKTDWLVAAGIAESDWAYVDYIAHRESGWNPNATNSSSGACGLIQAYPCSKVPGNGYDPVDNLRWANGYAQGRYGSWAGAYDFWINNHWW